MKKALELISECDDRSYSRVRVVTHYVIDMNLPGYFAEYVRGFKICLLDLKRIEEKLSAEESLTNVSAMLIVSCSVNGALHSKGIQSPHLRERIASLCETEAIRFGCIAREWERKVALLESDISEGEALAGGEVCPRIGEN